MILIEELTCFMGQIYREVREMEMERDGERGERGERVERVGKRERKRDGERERKKNKRMTDLG